MAISLSGLGTPFSPDERMRQLMAEYHGARDAQMQRLLDAGVAHERISLVAFAGCDFCHGTGWTTQSSSGDGSFQVTITDCPTCPGICLDGTPVVATRS